VPESTSRGTIHTVTPPTVSADLKGRIVEFARDSSTEISPHDEGILPELASTLPPRTTVYVAHTPKATLADVVRTAVKTAAVGLRASPHIVARRIDSEQALRAALRELKESGVEQVLLVAGDRNPPAGEFSSTLQILDSGATVDAGIKQIGVAGHPEGHPAVGTDELWQALQYKQAFAERTGTRMHIATQFSFKPDAVLGWSRLLVERGITLPVHLGVAGPTPLPKLIKFAVQCGIGASFGSLIKNMGAIGGLTGLATTPDQMVTGLVRGGAGQSWNRVIHPHVYAFGGVMATAKWLRSMVDGAFELDASGEKFTVAP
jgi:methylenetetrahydrofolate reductase (NADPH)